MNPKHLLTVALCVFLCGRALAQEMDKELSQLAAKLAALTNENGKKKVTVLDFTDLHGGESELGKYVAEELTVNMVMVRSNFSVLDRANLRKILAEHKLTATGLVDPENAKKLGQFAGVDALILGTIIAKGQKTAVTAKIITTDTAEIVGAAKAEFTSDETVKQLLAKPAESSGEDKADEPKKDEKIISKSFGDLRVELRPLRIVNGNQYLLTMTLTNQNRRRSIWVALGSSDLSGTLKASVTDPSGSEFLNTGGAVSGIEYKRFLQYGFQGSPELFRATEIKSAGTISVTVKFFAPSGGEASAGRCNLQMEFLYGYDFKDNIGQCTSHNLITQIEATE